MGLEIQIDSLEDMCDLMCNNRIPRKEKHMGKEITVKAIINNMPTEITYPYLVVRHVEDELWWYGQYKDYQRASDVALEIGNGFVFEVEKGEVE